MGSKSLRIAAAAALAFAGISAHAAPVSVKLDFAAGSVGMKVGATNKGGDVSASVGAFKGVSGGSAPYDVASFVTYCVELTQSFQLKTLYAGSYELVDGAGYFAGITPALAAGSTVVLDRLVNLFSYLGGATTPENATQSAAIQLAVWESIYEDGATYGNVDRDAKTTIDGRFNAKDTTGAHAAIVAANGILAGAVAYTGPDLYSIKVLTNKDRQDFLVLSELPLLTQSLNAVPEPGTLALAFGALAGVGVAMRRRRSA